MNITLVFDCDAELSKEAILNQIEDIAQKSQCAQIEFIEAETIKEEHQIYSAPAEINLEPIRNALRSYREDLIPESVGEEAYNAEWGEISENWALIEELVS